MKIYRAALIGCSRMGAFIDNEVPPAKRPYSHAAGYEACVQTELVACADQRSEVMVQTGVRYGIPTERQYLDYREMITQEQPDIVSVATQPEQRAEIVIYAVEHGVKAIYAEKAFAASLADADAMVEAVERNGAILNVGTNRRWDPGYDQMKAVIDSGRLGSLESLVLHQTSSLFNSASHGFDLLQRLNSDVAVDWVQAHLPDGATMIDGDILRGDPIGHGIIQFANGVTAYALNTGRGTEIEAICSAGSVTALANGEEWQLREPQGQDYRGRHMMKAGVFPAFEASASTANLVADLVHSLDSGEAPRGGVRLARSNMELIFAFVESHQQGGARVNLPLQTSQYHLVRDRQPSQPQFTSAL